MISNETNLLNDTRVENDIGNSPKRPKVDLENHSILQMFVESSWEKQNIKNLANWLKSEGIDVNNRGWHYSWKYGGGEYVHNRPNDKATDKIGFFNRITTELKNLLPFLLKCNDNINFINEDNQSILHVYLYNTESDYLRSRGSRKSKILEIVKSLLERGASVNVVDNRGMTPLQIAARTRKMEVVRLMLDFSSNIDACDKWGNTLLHAVIYKNESKIMNEDDLCLDIVRILLAKGAHPNRKNQEGMTPVQLAVCKLNFDLLWMLKENGADFSVITKNNENLLFLAHKNCNFGISKFRMLKIINFLVDHGCEVNAQDKDGHTSLHLAIQWNRSVERLIELGANVNCQSKIDGQTPLHTAVEMDGWWDETIVILLRAGADCDVVDFEGRTPFHIALENNNFKYMRRILEFGGNINDLRTSNLLKKCRIETRETVMSHARKLKTIGLPINDAYHAYLHENPTWAHGMYLKEVNKLKTCEISDGVSLYTFLHMNFRQQLTLVQSLPQDLNADFPIYASFILAACNNAVRRNQLLEPAKFAWYRTTEINLPDICVERILYFLNNRHLKVLIAAAEVTTGLLLEN